MFQKILVAMDTSAISKYVFEEALFLAVKSKANLMLLHVLSSEEEGSPKMPLMPRVDYYSAINDKILDVYHEQWNFYEKQGLQLLRSRQVEAATAGLSAEFTQPSGNPGRTICDAARNWGADLIVMGRRGRSGWSELILGSVSNYVLHHAPCSVLTVQHPLKTPLELQQSDRAEVRH